MLFGLCKILMFSSLLRGNFEILILLAHPLGLLIGAQIKHQLVHSIGFCRQHRFITMLNQHVDDDNSEHYCKHILLFLFSVGYMVGFQNFKYICVVNKHRAGTKPLHDSDQKRQGSFIQHRVCNTESPIMTIPYQHRKLFPCHQPTWHTVFVTVSLTQYTLCMINFNNVYSMINPPLNNTSKWLSEEMCGTPCASDRKCLCQGQPKNIMNNVPTEI